MAFDISLRNGGPKIVRLLSIVGARLQSLLGYIVLYNIAFYFLIGGDCMRRVAAYCGTRNLYEDMLTAAKSLIMNSSIDKIYFIIEDDKFPYLLPDCIECINISNQTYFRPDGPNFKSIFTYMALIRAALTKVLPDEDLVLSLDVDTIIDENIDELWEIDMEKYYMAAVREPKRSTGSFLYTNFGVCLVNLKKLREVKKDD